MTAATVDEATVRELAEAVVLDGPRTGTYAIERRPDLLALELRPARSR